MAVAQTTERDNVVLVGAKPPMNYVLAAVTLFSGDNTRVVVRARGRAISRAVDVAEIVRQKFVEGVRVEKVEIGTERLAQDGRKAINVSTIEIHLAKQA